MPELKEIVINTSPLLAIIAACSNLEILRKLYKKVYVPFEVHEEILKGGITGFGIKEFERAKFLNIQAQPTNISNLPQKDFHFENLMLLPLPCVIAKTKCNM